MHSRGFLALFCAVGVLAAGCGADPRRQAGENLFHAFQDSCVTQGPWTGAALTQNSRLIDAINSIMRSPACAGLQGVLQGIQSSALTIQSQLRDPWVQDSRRKEEVMQELTLALGSASDPTTKDLLRTALVEAQVAHIVAKTSGIGAREDRYFNVTNQLSSTMQSILPALTPRTGSLALCLAQNPAAAVQISTSLLAMSGNFISPVVGGAASVLGGLVSLGVEYAVNEDNVQEILRLAGAQMPTALACGLETMSELYCNANDAHDLIELQAQSYPARRGPPEPLWLGLDLLSRRLPVLRNWLLRIRNGVTPTNPYEAARQIEAWERIQALDNAYLNIQSQFIQGGESDAQLASSPAARQEQIRAFMIGIAYQLSAFNDDNATPFRPLRASAYQAACLLSRGGNTPLGSCPRPANGNSTPLGDYIDANNLVPEQFTTLVENWRLIYARVYELARVYFSQNISADAGSIITEATQAQVDNASPKDILVSVRSFAANSLTHATEANHRHLTEETISLIDQALTLIDLDPDLVPPTNSLPQACRTAADQSDPNDPERVTRIRVGCLFEVLRLRQGLAFISDRLTRLIRWEVQRAVRNGEFPANIRDILTIAGGEIHDRVVASGIDIRSLDTNRAREISQSNLTSFRNYFAPILPDVVGRLAREAREAGEPRTGANRPKGQVLGHLCSLVLATGSRWPGMSADPEAARRAYNICRQSTYSSEFPDPDHRLNLNFAELEGDLSGKPYTYRFCAFHRFLRASRMAELTRGRREIDPNTLVIFQGVSAFF